MNIKDSEAHRMAQELAQLRGVSLTKAVAEAIREGLDRERRRRGKKSLSTELLEIGKRCATHIKRPSRSSDHGALLYDRKGLPR